MHPIYKIWDGIIQRCLNPNFAGYSNYGGRGIRVCPEWHGSFEAFASHIGPRPTDKHSVDRINNEGHYEPGNVRWATAKEQANNRRNTPGYNQKAPDEEFISYQDERMPLSEFSERTGIHPIAVKRRFNIWDDAALIISDDRDNRFYLWDGIYYTSEELAAISKVPFRTMIQKLGTSAPDVDEIMDSFMNQHEYTED
jgi:hypothetical protein